MRASIHLANVGVCPITELVVSIDLCNVAAAAELLRNTTERPDPP